MKRFLFPLLMALATSAAGQTTQLRALDTDYAAASWKAVGRLDFGRGAQCSGTLIAKDLVLTAAHCLYRPDGVLWPTDQIRFHAGLRDGKAVTTRRAADAAAHTRFKPGSRIDQENVTYDVALIRLSEPISSFEVAPFYLFQGKAAPGPVSIVSYGRGRSEVQSRQKECQMLERVGDAMVFDCDVTFGSSGAPVFSHLNGRGQIMAVVSSMATVGGQKRAFGMALPDRVTELKRQLRMQVDPPRAKVRRITVGSGSNRSGLGAKFVRPGG